jgi:hypothetical protein
VNAPHPSSFCRLFSAASTQCCDILQLYPKPDRLPHPSCTGTDRCSMPLVQPRARGPHTLQPDFLSCRHNVNHQGVARRQGCCEFVIRESSSDIEDSEQTSDPQPEYCKYCNLPQHNASFLAKVCDIYARQDTEQASMSNRALVCKSTLRTKYWRHFVLSKTARFCLTR